MIVLLSNGRALFAAVRSGTDMKRALFWIGTIILSIIVLASIATMIYIRIEVPLVYLGEFRNFGFPIDFWKNENFPKAPPITNVADWAVIKNFAILSMCIALVLFALLIIVHITKKRKQTK